MTPQQDELIERLYHDYYSKLLLYAGIVLKDKDLAQDVVQDTFHEAIRQIETLTVRENKYGWLMKVLKNKLHEYERARSRDAKRFQPIDISVLEQAAITEPDPTDIPPLKKIQQALTQEEFDFLTRMIIDGASHMEMAKELNITVWCSRKRLERIRNKLAKSFPNHGREKKQKIF